MPAVLRAGRLVSFDSGASTAVVQLDGSLSSYLSGVTVAESIADAQMVADRRVLVAFVDADNPDDAVVIAVWV